MGAPKGFLKYNRVLPQKRDVNERKADYKELYIPLAEQKINEQAARCMDCGIPFCHSGCPLGNLIPDFNDAVYKEDWENAYEILSSTNNFPEFTGRICPAPCEASCVLGLRKDPVTIENIEKNIIETAFENGWVKPNVPVERTGKSVAVVGSGPAGLAAAEQLNKAGHQVTVLERNDKIGGLLRYGIPDFKMEKRVIDRRLAVMEAAGIEFKTNANVGVNISTDDLQADYDAVVLCGGSTMPRDLPIAGRELKGVHFAMDFLEESNRNVAVGLKNKVVISAKGKNVVVIGGGDTGADCVGTSNRQKAKSVTQIELLTKPPAERDVSTPWPLWPMQLRTSTSHEEGCDRQWSMMTKAFIGDKKGNLKALQLVDVEWKINPETGRSGLSEIAGTEREIPCEAAFLAIGFLHPQHEGMLTDLGVKLDRRGNVQATNYQTSNAKIFAAGDMRRGQSLVVWAMSEGREAAVAVDEYLMGRKQVIEEKELGVFAV